MSGIPKIDSPILLKLKKDIVDSVRSEISDGSITTLEELRAKVFDNFISFFKTVGSLPFNPREWKITDFKDPDVYNSNQEQIAYSIDILFSECKSLLESLINQFSLMTQSSEHLISKMNSIGDKLGALEESIEIQKFLELDQAVLTISDNFTDVSNIDFSYMDEVAANVNTSVASVSLGVDASKNRGANVKNIDIINVNKEEDSDSLDDSPGGDMLPLQPAAYEGNRFDFIGSSRPQTNTWRIETKNSKIDTANSEIEFDSYYSNLLNPDIIYEDDIIVDGPLEEEQSIIKVTYYEIFKDAVSIVDKATSIIRVGAEGNEVSGWVDTADGTSRTVADADTATYTAVAFEEEQEISITTAGPYSLVEEEGNRFTPDEYIFDERQVDSSETIWNEQGSDDYAKTITREDLVYVETLPTENQLDEARMRLFDGDERTFWEIEYTPIIASLESYLYSLSDDEGTGAYQKYQTEATSYLEDAQLDDSLEFELKIELDNEYVLNYVDLSPFYFEDDETANFTVESISTQAENAPILEIDDFKVQAIGDGTNEKLSKRQLQLSGVQNSFGYKSQGFWTFEPRQVKTIFIKIKQDTPIANPYQLKNVQLLKKSNYSINQSKSKHSVDRGFATVTTNDSALSGNVLERGRTTRLVQMSYLETVLDGLSNGQLTGNLSGTTLSDQFSTNVSSTQSNDFVDNTRPLIGAAASTIGGAMTGAGGPVAYVGAAVSIVGAVLTAAGPSGSGGGGSSTTNKAYDDSGWQIGHQSVRTIWKRPRYAVGIREIGLYSKSYKEMGTIASKPYFVPVGDKEITLNISEKIPVSFMEYDPTQAWIEYFISINGKEIRIAPSKGAISSLPHRSNPSSINLAQHASGDIAEVRFVARIKRPSSSSLLNSDSKTPLLSRYSVQISS